MKARKVIGRTIVAVRQKRKWGDFGEVYMDVCLELDNGDLLIPMVSEIDGDYAVDFVVNQTGRRKKGRKP